jgi:hypothetical protein
VLFGYALEVRKQSASRWGQVERVRAPVGWVTLSFGEPTMLEVVDQCDHGAAVDPERIAESLLGLALGRGEVAEHSEVPRMQVESGQALGEAPVRVGAELYQEEAGSAAQFPGRGCLRAGGIAGHRADDITSLELFML